MPELLNGPAKIDQDTKVPEANYRYEAWRNLVLILAGILIGYSFDSFANIRSGLLSLTAFDMVFPTKVWPSLLSVLVILYVAKNAHGILVTLYDSHYERELNENMVHVVLSWFLTAMLVVSFALVTKMCELVDDGRTLNSRCIRLMAFTLFPNIVLLLFDVFHIRAFAYNYGGGTWAFLRGVCREVVRNPMHRDRHESYKIIWLVENAISMILLTCWGVVLGVSSSPPVKIGTTLVTLGALLVINSVIDYVLNCRYFFFGEVVLGVVGGKSVGRDEDRMFGDVGKE